MRWYWLILAAAIAALAVISGCTATEGDPIVGTWQWSNGKGYNETYTFLPDHSFLAQALGSDFYGKWEQTSPLHYEVIYHYANKTERNETLTDLIILDEKTNAIYFPAHNKISG